MLCLRRSVVALSGALLLIVLVGLAILLTVFAHLGSVLVNALPTF